GRVPAVVVAHHAETGPGVELVVGAQALGGQRPEAHVGVRVAGDAAVAVAVPRRGHVAVPGGPRVADELDLPSPRRWLAEDRSPVGGDQAAELADGPRAFRTFGEPHGVLAGRQA